MADIVYFVRDMLFTSKIREVATQLGLKAQGAPDSAALVRAAVGAKLAIVDLRLDRALDVLDALQADPTLAGLPRIGFVDHEKIDVMDAARAHGCQQVLTKGQFSKELPALLGALAATAVAPTQSR